MVGCLGNLYESIENLSEIYIQPNQRKNTLLEPKTPAFSLPLLPLNDASPPPPPPRASSKNAFFRCPYNCRRESDVADAVCDSHRCYVTDDKRAICPKFYNIMSTTYNLNYVAAPPPVQKTTREDAGGFVRGVVTSMVMDDLVVMPMSTISSIALLNKFNVKEVGALEEKVVNLGMTEAFDLLKTSMVSKTVLTDVFLKNMGK